MAVSKPDFTMQFGSAKADLNPISASNYSQGWDFVGSTPPTKNDFTYLQFLSDQRALWLNENKAAIAGSSTQDFAVRNSGDVNNAVNNARLDFKLSTYALKVGDSSQAFAMANSGTGVSGVNNDRLNFVLQGYAAVGGNQFTPFAVGGATSGTQAVRLDQFQGGNNTNGAWVKLPGGAMWCRQNLTLAANATTQWNYPATFPAPPAVFITAINGPFQCWLNGIGPGNAGIFNNGAALNVNLLAIY